jgi:hypothetical protein
MAGLLISKVLVVSTNYEKDVILLL